MWKAEADTSYRCHTEVTHSQMEVFNFQVPYSYRETWTRAYPFWEFCTLFNRPEQCWDLGAHSAASLPYQNFTQDLWYKVHYSPRWPFQKLLQELITSVHNYICSQRCWSQHGSGTNAPHTFSYIYQLIFSNRINLLNVAGKRRAPCWNGSHWFVIQRHEDVVSAPCSSWWGAKERTWPSGALF